MSFAKEEECQDACQRYHQDVGRDVEDDAGRGRHISVIRISNCYISITNFILNLFVVLSNAGKHSTNTSAITILIRSCFYYGFSI